MVWLIHGVTYSAMNRFGESSRSFCIPGASLAARGLGGIPQAALGFFAGIIREFLGIPDELKLLFGISFGYPDDDAPGNRVRMDRVPLDTSVSFHA